MELEGECPVCGASFSLEIDDPDAGSLEYDCECGASLVISYSVTIEVDDVEVSGGATAEFECPRDGTSGSLEISDEDGEEEVECDSCGAVLSVSWSSWGQETQADITAATVEFECPSCGNSGDLEITDESGEEEVECDSCEATLSVTWSDWGAQVEVTVLDEPDGDDDEDQDEDDDDEDDETTRTTTTSEPSSRLGRHILRHGSEDAASASRASAQRGCCRLRLMRALNRQKAAASGRRSHSRPRSRSRTARSKRSTSPRRSGGCSRADPLAALRPSR